MLLLIVTLIIPPETVMLTPCNRKWKTKSNSPKINACGIISSKTKWTIYPKTSWKLLTVYLLNLVVFKYFTNQCPYYLNKVSESAYLDNLRTINSCLKLVCPLRKTNTGQNVIFFISYSIWNKNPEVFKKNPATLILSNITQLNTT